MAALLGQPFFVYRIKEKERDKKAKDKKIEVADAK